MKSLMQLVNELVEEETQDAIALREAGHLAPFGGSYETLHARKCIESRIESIRDAAIRIGIDGDAISELLDGNE